MGDLRAETSRKLERLCKWRLHFAGWQLGTRVRGDPECDAVRDHREVSMLLRAEVSAILGLLIEKGVCTQDEMLAALGVEADELSAGYSRRWPGVEATDAGMAYNTAVIAEHESMKGWLP